MTSFGGDRRYTDKFYNWRYKYNRPVIDVTKIIPYIDINTSYKNPFTVKLHVEGKEDNDEPLS
jgi:hypothetical protein